MDGLAVSWLKSEFQSNEVTPELASLPFGPSRVKVEDSSSMKVEEIAPNRREVAHWACAHRLTIENHLLGAYAKPMPQVVIACLVEHRVRSIIGHSMPGRALRCV